MKTIKYFCDFCKKEFESQPDGEVMFGNKEKRENFQEVCEKCLAKVGELVEVLKK